MERDPAFIADVPKRRKKRPEKDDPKYLDWVAEHLFCAVTGSKTFVIHHLRRDENGPMGKGRHDDRWVIPLHPLLHDNEPGSLHKMGERNFFESHGIEYMTLSAMLRTAYEMDDPERAKLALINARVK